MMINPKRKLFVWGPIDGRPIYAYYWCRGFAYFTREFPPGWPGFISYFKNEKFWAIADFNELRQKSEQVFKKYALPDRQFYKNFRRYRVMLKRLEAYGNSLPKKLTKENLSVLIIKWHKVYADDFWNIGSLPEVANWGGEKLLFKELKKKIKNSPDFNYALERLSAPEDFSFYQKEELDLLTLKKIKNKKRFQRALADHQRKYFWLLNSYHHSKILPVRYFKKILLSISRRAAGRKIKDIHNLKNSAIKNKKEIIKKFKLPNNILKISRRLAFCIWWQDQRKSYIFRANQTIDFLLKALATRTGVNFDDLRYYSVNEIEALAEKAIKLSVKEINSRKKAFFIIFSPNSLKEYHFGGARAEQAAEPFIRRKVKREIKEFKGLAVSRGKVKGRVRVLFSASEARRMKQGEILVAPMTSPDYILALRKAAAVVTDEGGLTCHAAIVSRELGIPGIVGTKIATKTLKDGDLVEVDADKGIVKLLIKQ